MLIQPTADSPGIFVDRLRVESVTPDLSFERARHHAYVITFTSGATAIVSRADGERLLAELAAK